jgi:ABC-2 type transport system permease protein
MRSALTIARKELRSYFTSPVALIFLGAFLVATLFSFFTGARFFARNIADVRPLFEWLPALMIFLVAAITMRAWSEEQKMGTLEILFTLPLRTRDLVLGKLLAGMALVALALALTLPLPITVAALGDLDWGPVVGGYVGALLLGAAYMTIGMCVSARTDNQIVSLMVTLVIGGLLYLVGSDTVAAFFGNDLGELLRELGSGSRFRSIERGVIDLRDLAYYASLAIFFAVLNVHFLEGKKADALTGQGRRRRRARLLTLGLVALNAAALNAWLAPVGRARIDMTQEGLYSISAATEGILARLDEPVTISGYFSEKTHPLLAPLVPRIRDVLTEYQIRGRGKVRVEFADPNKDDALQEELGELYNIKPVPFRVSDRTEEAVVNSYFHLLVRYGDQYNVLSFGDLIEVSATDSSVDVRLRNLEYDITRSIKRVSEGFQSVEGMFAKLDEPAKLTLFDTPGALPDELKDVPDRVRKAAEELAGKSGGKLAYAEKDVTDDAAAQAELRDKYGFRPMAADLFGEKTFYLYLVLETGGRLERIFLQGEVTEAAARTAIEGALKRGTPGFLKKVALLTANPENQPQNPNLPPQFQPPQARPDFRGLEDTLSEDLAFERIQAEDGVVPPDVNVLIVGKTGALTDKQRFAVDQYLMQGGAVIALQGAYDIQADRQGLRPVKADQGLLDLLAAYGAKVEGSFALDESNARFPVPIEERRGPFAVQRIQMMNYPFFPDVRRDGFAEGHVAVSGLRNVVMNWASPIDVAKDDKGVKSDVLISTSEKSWSYGSDKILPDSLQEADTAFQPSGGESRKAVAVAMTGVFKSYYADKPSPLFGAGKGEEAGAAVDKKEDRTGRTIKESAKEARLVVVGSSAFASDLVASLGDQIGGGVYRGNFQLVRNLVDWALADTDLLGIRTAGAFARTLKPLEDKERGAWEIANYAVALLALAAVVAVSIVRRRRVRPLAGSEVKP